MPAWEENKTEKSIYYSIHNFIRAGENVQQ